MAEGLLYRRRVWTRTPPRGVIVSPSGSGLARGLVFAHDFGAGDIGGLPLLGPPAGPWTASSASTDQTRERGTKTETNGYFHAYAPWNRDAIENGFTSLLLARYITRAAASNFILGDVSTGTSDYNWGHYISNGTNGYAFFVRNNSGAAVNTIQSSIFVGDGFYALGGRYNKSTGKVTGAVNGVLSAEVSQSGTVAKTALKYSANLWWTTSYLSLIYYRHFLWDRPLSDNELINATRSPWQLYAPANSPIFYSLPGGGSSYNDSLTDTADASDSASTALAALGTISDSGALTDTASSTLAAIDALADSGALTDSATSAHVAVEALADSAAATDATSTVLSAVDALTDSAAASETISGTLVMTEALTDSAAATDSATGTVGAQSYTDLLTDNAASTDAFTASVSSGELASGGWDFFLRPIRHRDPPETLPEARKAVKTVVRRAKKLRERVDELAAEAAHLTRQSEQRERTEATIDELRAQVQQYEQIAAQLRIHVELLIEQQREDDDLEILLLAA